MASVTLKGIYKKYPGGVTAVSDFNLDIEDKEFIILVGPSGCGKSTTLRMIAGLEEISEGELYIGAGQDFTITFTPDEGNVVSRLVVDGEQVEAANSYTFKNLSADHTIRVEFGKTVASSSSSSGGDNPSTGDASSMGLGVAVLLVAASACALVLSKRK